ncbi:hypothetical protein AQ611_19640 [Burkholderia singularis]|nr:hypothetical protein AQ611_19640 [Burkholderia sp. Bp7605]
MALRLPRASDDAQSSGIRAFDRGIRSLSAILVFDMTFSTDIRVRYCEIDQQNVVFNMWYVAYLGEAWAAFLEFRELPYRVLASAGTEVQLVHLEIDWRGSLSMGDSARIDVQPIRIGTTSFTLGFDIWRDSAEIASAKVVYVCIATDGSGKKPVPEVLLRALKGHE